MKLLLLFPILALTSCCSPANVDASLKGAAQLRQLYELEQRNTRKLVEASNPTQAVLERFILVQDQNAATFLSTYSALTAQLASIGQLDPAQVNAILDRVEKVLEK